MTRAEAIRNQKATTAADFMQSAQAKELQKDATVKAFLAYM